MQSYGENDMLGRTKWISSSNNVEIGLKGKGRAVESSPPRTPTTPRSAGAALKLQTTPRETFLDDITPVDFNSTNDEDERVRDSNYRSRDSHDLSLSPQQITRDSLVDNMLLSLDQFSLGQVGAINPTDDDMQLYSSFADGDDYEDMKYSTPKARRPPGHHYSYSSDYDNVDDGSRFSSQYSRGRRSNSSSTFQSGPGIMNSTRNDPLAGIAPYQHTQRTTHTRNQGGSRDSSASSLDLTYGQGTAAKRWDSRRSSSFDNGQEREGERNFRLVNVAVPSFSPLDYDAAPTPNVPVGPRRIPPPSPMQQPASSHGTQHVLERKRSAKSTRNIRTTPSETASMDTKHFRGRSDHDRDLPSLPAFIKETAPAPLVGYGKSKEGAYGAIPISTQQAKDRPGFFRRVFGGSSKNNLAIAAEPALSQGSTTSVETSDRPRSKPQHIANQIRSRVPTPEAPQSRPALTKKPSSFFRRRKKSMSENEPPMPPPAVPPLNLHSHPAAKQTYLPQASVSPVSSLRQVMNPYLSSPIKSHSYMHYHATLDQEVAKPIESVRESIRYGSADKKATIRAVSREGYAELAANTSTRIPNDKARNEYGTTFLRDSSDNDREVQSSTSSQAAMKDRNGETRFTSPTSHSSSAVARDSTHEVEHGQLPPRLFSLANEDKSSSPSMAQMPIHTHTNNSGPLVPEKDGEWILLSQRKPVSDKNERIVLSPASFQDNPKETIQATDRAVSRDATKESVRASGSTVTDYKSATSVPIVQVEEDTDTTTAPRITLSDDVSSLKNTDNDEKHSKIPTEGDRVRAKQIYDGNEDFISQAKAATWLGEEGVVRHRTLVAYMELYEFLNLNILAGLRVLCGRLVLKAESQQVDRILDMFARRWCECNPNHGFKLIDVVHTICYSILLLNTDLHMADIEQKMTRSQFVKNTMPTIRHVIATNAPDAFEPNRPSILPKSQTFEVGASVPRSSTEQLPLAQTKSSIEMERPSWRSSFKPPRVNNEGNHGPTPLNYESPADDCGPLVRAPFYGTLRTWEVQLEIVLKDFYGSIRSERLPLFGASLEKPQSQQPSQSTLSVFASGMLRRTPSILSKAPSDIPRDPRARTADTARLGTGKWSAKNRSRPRLYANSAMSSSRTSLDDQSSMWSPSVASSTWTKYSLGKTQTSMSVDSYGSSWAQGDYQQSIGFANALSQAIIREETVGSAGSAASEELRVAPLLEDESLELVGAPWAKEGIVKHKHHLESLEKKAKDRNWKETFAVIEKGYMSLFSFTSKSMRRQAKGKPISGAGSVVGGGNWQENAESLGSFLLRQTIASALPSPGYSKARPHVWALSLPTGAVHLFQVGTPEIVREFVSTANYWSARLSNHPLVGGISNIEYGWSDSIINNALVSAINETTRPSTSHGRRPSVQSSLRGSIDQGTGVRARLPGDKIHITDWTPPTQSMRASNLMEQDQLNTLLAYVKGIEDELQKHNQLRNPMFLAFTPRHPNYQKAMANWEKKSSYLLREIVKFKTYIDCLQAADIQKQRLYSERAAEKALAETAEDDEEAHHFEDDTTSKA